MIIMERDPNKRKVKPAQMLLQLDELGESSDDSDFRIEDHCDDSDDDTVDSAKENTSSDEEESGNDSDDDDGESTPEIAKTNHHDGIRVLSEVQNIMPTGFDSKAILQIMICSVCLGDRSDAQNEIIECDKCGVTVHEGCYGVQDTDSVCSTDSPNPTTPWFCDPCKAAVVDPKCEICPNSGGIYKETDVGQWVHVVCALYTPGVAFADVDRLASVTLFEMSYAKWGAKPCALCRDRRLAATGVTVGCDAALCKNYFHATCGQREGLLIEAHTEEVDQADPFYAHCKLHSDKALIKKRKRNWLALSLRYEELAKHRKEGDEMSRIDRVLAKYRAKYRSQAALKPQPWVPTQKMARLLTSSASACLKLWHKAELSGVDTALLELRQAHADALAAVSRRWHVQPSFSVEFIAYFLERASRVDALRSQLNEAVKEHEKLRQDQAAVQIKRDEVLSKNHEESDENQKLKFAIESYHELIKVLTPHRPLPQIDLIGRPILYPPSHHRPSGRTHSTGSSVPTPAALKAGLGYSVKKEPCDDASEVTGNGAARLNQRCSNCGGSQDQHLLAKCDTCTRHYHLGCLNPPLLRMPKKTKLMGWQCSECDNDSDSSRSGTNVDTEAPRKLRRRDSLEEKNTSLPASDIIKEEFDTSVSIKSEPNVSITEETEGEAEISARGGKKRRREKHRRYSPDPNDMGRPHKHKHRRHRPSGDSSDTPPVTEAPDAHRQSLKICFKSVPSTGGGSSYVATPSSDLSPLAATGSASGAAVTSTVSTPASPVAPPIMSLPRPGRPSVAKKQQRTDDPIECITCHQPGTSANLVKCDECLNGYHFQCLDPPVKKSPKVRGYSWHCANCDPTESD